MSWTLSVMKNRIRNLCTLQEPSQLSEANLLAYLNRFYTWQLPKEIKPIQLNTWYDVTLADGDESYDLKKDFYDTYVRLDPLAYISSTEGRKDYQMSVYYNLEDFYAIWPDGLDYTDSSNTAKPSSVLIYNNQLLFRKCPDDTYYFSMKAIRRPLVYVNETAITTTANEFVNDNDTPEVEEWGQFIVYGTVKNILEEMGSLEDLQAIMNLYMNEKSNIHSQTLGWSNGLRAKPRF